MVRNGFNGDVRDLENPYRLRPNYYLFKLYADHFKEALIKTEVVAEQFNENIEYLSVVSSKSNNNSSICVMVINRKDEPINVDLYIKDFYYNATVDTYSISGQSLESHNEDGETVNIKESSAVLNNQVCNITLQKYSITAIVINKTREK
jgi:alpha-L-arabinofuranosidase